MSTQAIDAAAKAMYEYEKSWREENNPSLEPLDWPEWSEFCSCDLNGIGADCICGDDEAKGTKFNYLAFAHAARPFIESELRTEIAEEIKKAKAGAWGEGFLSAHMQHYSEDERLGRRTPAIVESNPYTEES